MKLVCPVRIDRDVASIEQGGLVAVCHSVTWLIGSWNGAGSCGSFPSCLPLHDALIGAREIIRCFRFILSEEEIEQEPDTGSKEQHDHPGNRFQRIPILCDDNQY